MIVKIRVQPVLSKVKVTVHLKVESENQGKAVFSKVKVKIRVKQVSSKMKVTVKGKGEIRVELCSVFKSEIVNKPGYSDSGKSIL